MLSCNGSLERREGILEGRRSCVEAPCSTSRKHRAGSRKLLISCHPSEIQGGAGVVESIGVSRLSKILAL